MSILEMKEKGSFFFDSEVIKGKGKQFHEQYNSAEPFPNIALDDFLDPAVIDACIEHFPVKLDPDAKTHSRHTENLKTSYSPDYLVPELRTLFYAFNSKPFITFLEEMTGIEGLIPDPYFTGGGFHETRNGGHLGIHADFNFHKSLKLERRINVLIYLNKDWDSSYGGQLELWDKKMKKKVASIDPVYNRVVVFNTTSESFHGQPDPINHPDGVSRRSIALYYYTATWDETKRDHTTQFKARPDTGDKFDTVVWVNEKIKDFLPPIAYRMARRLMGKSSNPGQ